MSHFNNRLVVVALCIGRFLAAEDVIRIGGLFPLFLTEHYEYSTFSGGVLRASAFLKAIQDINNKSDLKYDNLLPDCKLDFDIGDSRLDKASAFTSAQDLFGSNFEPHVIVGPDTEDEAVFAIAAIPDTPFVSYSSSSSDLTLDEAFPNIISIVPSTADYSQAMVSLLLSNNWERVGILSSSDTDSVDFSQNFISVATSAGITILDNIAFEQEDDLDSIKDKLKPFFDDSVRIVILITSSVESPVAIAALYHSGLTGIDGAQIVASPSVLMSSSLIRLAIDYNFTQQQIKESMMGMLGFVPIGSDRDASQAFLDDLILNPPIGNYSCDALSSYGSYLAGDVQVYATFNHDGESGTDDLCAFIAVNDLSSTSDYFDPFAAYAYDAVITLAVILDDLRNEYLDQCGDDCSIINDDGPSNCLTSEWFSADAVMDNAMRIMNDDTDTDGVTGRITLNQYIGRNMMDTELVLQNFYSTDFDSNWDNLEAKYVTNISNPYSLYPAGDLSFAFQRVATFTFPNEVYQDESAEYDSSSKKALIWDTGVTVEYSTSDGKPISDGSLKEQSQVPVGLTAALYLSSLILLLEAIALSIYTYVMRTNRLIRLSQPPLLHVVLLAGAIVSISCFLAAETVQNDDVCIARAWFFHFGIILMLSGLAIKTYRVHIIVNNKKFKRIKFGDKKVVRMLFMITLATIVYMAFWTVFDAPTKSRSVISNDKSGISSQSSSSSYHSLDHDCDDAVDDDCGGLVIPDGKETLQVIYYCRPGDRTLHTLLRAAEVIALAITGYFSWLTRDVPAVFNESRYIAASIQVTVCTFLVAFPTSTFLRDRQKYLESSFTDWFSVSIVLIIVISLIFLPKVYGVINDVEIQENYGSNNMKAMSKMGPMGVVFGILCCCCGSLGVCDFSKMSGNNSTSKNDEGKQHSPSHASQANLLHTGRSENNLSRMLSSDKPAFHPDEVREMESRFENPDNSLEGSQRRTVVSGINLHTSDSVGENTKSSRPISSSSNDESPNIKNNNGSEARREVVKLALTPSDDTSGDDDDKSKRRRKVLQTSSSNLSSDREMTVSEVDDLVAVLDIEETMPIPVQINQYELVKSAILRKMDSLAAQQEKILHDEEQRRKKKVNPPELPPRKSGLSKIVEMRSSMTAEANQKEDGLGRGSTGMDA